MTVAKSTAAGKTSRAPAQRVTEKREAKRQELTEKALHALARYGFVDASLRAIAKDVGVPLSALHYYFDKKTDMIAQCMTLYKTQFIERLSQLIVPGDSADATFARFTQSMVNEIEKDAILHRLWYDMRVQSLYSDDLRPTVDQFETTFIQFSDAFLTIVGGKNLTGEEVYRLFDGLFFNGVRDVIHGDPDARQKFLDGMDHFYRRITGETS